MKIRPRNKKGRSKRAKFKSPHHGEEAKAGYAPPRIKWSNLTEEERHQQAIEKLWQ